jgi:hypothetical protein
MAVDGKQTGIGINSAKKQVYFEDATNPLCYNYGTDQWSLVPAYAGIGFYDVDSGVNVGLDRNSGNSYDLQQPTTSDVAQTATLTTAERDINQGGRVVLTGVRPLTDGGTKAVDIGHRNSLSTTVSFSTTYSLNSRTNMANMRIENRYLRVRTTITGGFNTAMGADIEFSPAGKV